MTSFPGKCHVVDPPTSPRPTKPLPSPGVTKPLEFCVICGGFWLRLAEHLRFVHREEVVMTIGGKR